MKTVAAIALALIFLLLLFGVCGLFAAIFHGILWMIATHWIVSLCIGMAVSLITMFVLRVIIEAIDN
jgi:hypothetical protein